jgi:hypothetical protein
MSMTDFWNCSLWEFAAAVEGWNKAQGGDAHQILCPLIAMTKS